jgi:hypothetical protein
LAAWLPVPLRGELSDGIEGRERAMARRMGGRG